jgi:hypothetical protein
LCFVGLVLDNFGMPPVACWSQAGAEFFLQHVALKSESARMTAYAIVCLDVISRLCYYTSPLHTFEGEKLDVYPQGETSQPPKQPPVDSY